MQEPDIQQMVEDLTSALQIGPEDQDSVASESPSPIRSQDGSHSETRIATQLQSGQGMAKAKNDPGPAHSNLLTLLKGPKGLASSKNQALEAARPGPANSILAPISEERAKGISTKLEAKANRQQSQFLTQYHPSSSDNVLDDQPIPAKRHAAETIAASDDSEKENSEESWNSAKQKATKNQSIVTKAPSAESGMPPSSNDAEENNSQENVHSPKRTVAVQETTSAQSHTCNTNQKATAPFVDMFQDSNPFEGLKRVPRRFVRIPAVQQALLERRESWYKPISGGRQAYATIPPKVRAQMDAFLNRQYESDHSDQSDDGSEESVDTVGSDESQDEDEEAQGAPPRRAVSCEEVVGSTSASVVSASASSQQLRQPPVLTLDIAHATTVSSSGLHEDEQPDDENLDIGDGSSSLVEDMDEPEDPQGATKSASREESLSQLQSTDNFSEHPEQPPSPDTPKLPSLPHKKLSAVGARTRMPNFPSSSPTEQDELPLALPHAMDDVFEEDEEPLHAPETSQKLPCTAPPNPNLIQVETTPSTDPYANGSSLLLPKESKGQTKINHSSQQITSSQIIPATFDNSRPVQHMSNSRRHSTIQYQTRQEESPEPASPTPVLQPCLKSAEVTDSAKQNCSSSIPLEEQATSSTSSIRKQKSPIVQIPATSRKSKPSPAVASSPIRASGRRAFHVDNASSKENPPAPMLKQHPRASTIESDEAKAIDIKQVLKEKKHSWVTNYLQVKKSKQNAPFDLEESLPNGNTAVGEEARISSTYVESSPRNSPISKEHIRPPYVHLNSADADEESDMQAPIAQVSSELRSPSLDNVVVVQEQFDVLPFASQEVVDLRSPSPDDTRIAQEDEANVPFLASEAVPNCEIPCAEIDAAEAAEEEVEKQHHASQRVSGLGENASAAGKELAESQCAASHVASNPQYLALDEHNAVIKTDPLELVDFDTSPQIMFYDEFKATYPDYEGSEGAFIRALVYLEWLLKECKTSPSYYDDFVRFMVSYERHVRGNQHLKEKPPPGFVVYNQTIQKPIYRYNIISSRNLEAALLTLDLQVVAFVRSKYWTNQKTVKESTRNSTAGPIAAESQEEDIILDNQGAVASNKPHCNQASQSQDRSSIPKAQSHLKNSSTEPKKPFFVTASQLASVIQQKPEPQELSRMSQISSNESDGIPRSGFRSQQMSVFKQSTRVETPSRAFQINSDDGDKSRDSGRSQQFSMVKQEAVDTPIRASQVSSNGSGSKPRSRKTLARLTEKPNKLASSVASRARDSPPRSSTSGRGGKVDWAEVRLERKRREREEAARSLEYLGSPILGSLRDHISPPEPSPSPLQTKRKRISESFTFGQQDDPFIENPKPSKVARRVTMPALRSMDDLPNASHEKKRKRTSEGSLSHETSFTETSKPSKAARRVTLPAAKSNEVKAWMSPKLTRWERILERKKLDGKRPKSETIKKLTGIDFGTVKRPEVPAEPETQGFEF